MFLLCIALSPASRIPREETIHEVQHRLLEKDAEQYDRRRPPKDSGRVQIYFGQIQALSYGAAGNTDDLRRDS